MFISIYLPSWKKDNKIYLEHGAVEQKKKNVIQVKSIQWWIYVLSRRAERS